jgi:hypothetical protein
MRGELVSSNKRQENSVLMSPLDFFKQISKMLLAEEEQAETTMNQILGQ